MKEPILQGSMRNRRSHRHGRARLYFQPPCKRRAPDSVLRPAVPQGPYANAPAMKPWDTDGRAALDADQVSRSRFHPRLGGYERALVRGTSPPAWRSSTSRSQRVAHPARRPLFNAACFSPPKPPFSITARYCYSQIDKAR